MPWCNLLSGKQPALPPSTFRPQEHVRPATKLMDFCRSLQLSGSVPEKTEGSISKRQPKVYRQLPAAGDLPSRFFPLGVIYLPLRCRAERMRSSKRWEGGKRSKIPGVQRPQKGLATIPHADRHDRYGCKWCFPREPPAERNLRTA